MENGTVPGTDERHPDLLAESQRRTEAVLSHAGLDSMTERNWTSRSNN